MKSNFIQTVSAVVICMQLAACGGGGGSTPPTVSSAKLSRTGQTISYDTNIVKADDGGLQKGVAWPSPRFVTSVSGTNVLMTDKLTGLMWTSDANAPGPLACSPGANKNWQAALDYVPCLNANNYLGFTDWRLPNILEMESLTNKGAPDVASWLTSSVGFVNVQTGYWSATTAPTDTTKAVTLYMPLGEPVPMAKGSPFSVWPVRTNQSVSPLAALPRTGQVVSYDANTAAPIDDGALQKGTAWPATRFVLSVSGTGTATGIVSTDNLTNLMWTRDGNAPGPAACGPGTTMTWQVALDYVACLNTNGYMGYTDWRLPNTKEMWSLINEGAPDNATWLTAQGFVSAQLSYWTSTTLASSTTSAYLVNLTGYSTGSLGSNTKSTTEAVWPVRGGQ